MINVSLLCKIVDAIIGSRDGASPASINPVQYSVVKKYLMFGVVIGEPGGVTGGYAFDVREPAFVEHLEPIIAFIEKRHNEAAELMKRKSQLAGGTLSVNVMEIESNDPDHLVQD